MFVVRCRFARWSLVYLGLICALTVQLGPVALSAADENGVDLLRGLGVQVERYTVVRQRRRLERWRKLHRFPAMSDASPTPQGWYLTLDDRHLDDQGRVKSGVLKLFSPDELIQGISVRNTELSNQGLTALGRFSALLALDLNGTFIDDVGLEQFVSWPMLREVDLGDTEITDSGLRHLQRV